MVIRSRITVPNECAYSVPIWATGHLKDDLARRHPLRHLVMIGEYRPGDLWVDGDQAPVGVEVMLCHQVR